MPVYSVHNPDKTDEVFGAILNFRHEHGYSPTVRELCQLVGLSSPASVQRHLELLIRQKRITKANGTIARSIQVAP